MKSILLLLLLFPIAAKAQLKGTASFLGDVVLSTAMDSVTPNFYIYQRSSYVADNINVFQPVGEPNQWVILLPGNSKAISGTAYSVTYNDIAAKRKLNCSHTGAYTVTLPPLTNMFSTDAVSIVDKTNNAGTYPITIIASDSIGNATGGTGFIMNINGQENSFYKDGTKWIIK